MTEGPVAVWDFTLASDHDDLTVTKDEIIDKLKGICKRWGFQHEVAAGGLDHFQGRFSLEDKARLKQTKEALGWKWIHLSPTSKKMLADSEFYKYVTKEKTRVDGPWTDKSERVILIPKFKLKKLNEIKLYTWQQQIVDECTQEEAHDRHVNVLYDAIGAKGKSTIVSFLEQRKVKVMNVPVSSKDTERLVTNVSSWCLSRGEHACLNETFAMIFDLPRSEVHSEGLYKAIETIKGGRLSDWRYKLTEVNINHPHIWVFTNKMPKTEMLSSDRWKFWFIDNRGVLQIKAV